jgi:hypothetical protein
MILFKINVNHIAMFELECDAPGTVDMDSIAPGQESAQAMEIEPRQVHILGLLGDVQAVEAYQDSFLQLCVDL